MTFKSLRRAVAFALVASVAMVPGVAQAADNPTAWEQWLLYDINRARWDPYGYAAEHFLNPAGWAEETQPLPLPPLAFNTQLEAATGAKALYMAGGGTMNSNHCTPGPVCPNKLAMDNQYPLEWYWAPNENMIEVYWSGNGDGIPDFGAELFMGSAGHRPILFRWNDREDGGVGWSDRCPAQSQQGQPACNFLFVHVGSRAPYAAFITGFVYNDNNPQNGIMDRGEGLSGVTVSAGGQTTTTSTGGAYRIQVPDDRGYMVTASGGSFYPNATARACVTGSNVGVDFRDLGGTSQAVVHGYPGRLAGADRYATAVAVSQCSHPNPFPTNQGVVYVAVGTNYPDALAAAPAAAAQGAPILLVTPTGVPNVTLTELQRLHPKTIVVLGGPAAIADNVVSFLDGQFGTVIRRYGPSRYETAVAITAAAFPGTVNTVFVTTGEDYPDALIAGPATAAAAGALLLVRPNEIPLPVAAELERLQPARIVIVGNTSAVSQQVASQLAAYAPSVTRFSGADAPTRSALVSASEFPAARTAYIATGLNFPDALAAGPLAALMAGPILLVGTSIPSAVHTELNRLGGRRSILVLGGPVAVSDGIVGSLADYLAW